MRSEKSSKNAIVSVVYYIINSIFTFISKTIFIQYLGIEYSGLNSLLLNVLGVLNIAELGIGTAVGYSLYKPIAEKDTKKINEILALYKYVYRCIAIFIFIIGIIVTVFINKFINSNIDINEIRTYFLLYLLATITSYLFTFLNVLPAADQKNYLVVKIQGNAKIIKSIIQLIVVIVFKSYYIWLFIEIMSNCLMYIYTNLKIKKMYKYYDNNVNKKFIDLLKQYKEIVLKTKDLIFHKIGALAVYQTDNIVISYFGTLTDVGIYTNYMTIYTLLTGCIDQAFISITSSIGNLIVEKESEYVYKTWKEIHALSIFLATCVGFLFYKLANSFIGIWIGNEYIFSNIIVLGIAINIIFRIIKQPIDKFKEAYGIFEDKQAPFIEAIINLIVSIVLAKKIGVLGVVIGTIVSNIFITSIWKPYIVFKKGFKVEFKKYIEFNITYIIIAIISIIIANMLINITNISQANNIIELIKMFIVYGIIAVTVITTCFLTNKYFRQTIMKYLNFFINILVKRNKANR